MRIKKISPTTPANGNIENQYGTSQTNAYSEAYANTTFATKDTAITSTNGLMSASDKTLLNNETTYSTTETKIGTWIDGKPIYRQIIEETSGTASQTKTIATISNLGEIVNLYGFIRTTNQSVPINFVYNTEQNSCYRENNNIILRTTASSYVNKSCYVIVEYTKTTD